MYRTIIFDFFGVIHEDPQAQWLRSLGERHSEQFAAIAHRFDTAKITYEQYLQQLAEASGQPATVIHTLFKHSKPDSAVVDLIATLGREFKVGLLTNANAEELNPILDRHGLRVLFAHVTISSELGIAKPDEAIFMHALRSLGADASESIFVDDKLANVEAARQIGMHGIHFKHHTQLADEIQKITVAQARRGQ